MDYLLDEKSNQILSLFHDNNYEAFLVGGCVRDYLLKRPINDYDITTNATPDQIITLCNKNNIKIIPTGIKHGTITLLINRVPYEVTTYRKESEYEKNRFPKEVRFTMNLKEDVKRRDFTINALCMRENEIIDYFNGIDDLNNKLIRCVGEPSLRFHEDALRILRCLRFSFTLDFSIEENTYQALKENVTLLNNISNERIRDELCKMLMSNQKDILIKLKKSGVLDVILPEMKLIDNCLQETPWHIYDVFHHTNEVLNNSVNLSLEEKIALLFHDIKKVHHKTIDENKIAHFKGHSHTSATLAKEILRRLKFDNKTIKEVYKLIYYHDYHLSYNPKTIRKLLYEIQGDYTLAYRILEVQLCDNMGKNIEYCKENNDIIKQAILFIKEMEIQNECFNISQLAINGNDLLKIGYKPKELGNVLNYLLLYVLNQQEYNTKEHLLKMSERGKINEIINSK